MSRLPLQFIFRGYRYMLIDLLSSPGDPQDIDVLKADSEKTARYEIYQFLADELH